VEEGGSKDPDGLEAAHVRPPEHLSPDHDVSGFENGRHPTLDTWLRDRALASEGFSARTYVICNAAVPKRVVGYYAISTAMEQRAALPTARLRRGMPDRVPLLLVGRLALDRDFQGRGLGTELLVDALRRCLSASEIAGVRGIVAHAIDDDAVDFYRRHGFQVSPIGERVMLVPIETARALLAD
jgi:GNAT superfamily N-acetyltransferase